MALTRSRQITCLSAGADPGGRRPAICAAVLTGLLSAWVTISGTGTIIRVRIQITLAAPAAPTS